MEQTANRQVPRYIPACLITSCVAFLFGLDTGTIGPVTEMSSFKETVGDFSSTIHGVIVSSILLTGALAALLAGILADKYGRVRVIVVGSCIYGIGAAIECAAPLLGVFIVGRLIKGVGEGLFLSSVYVQVSEMSPSRIRGVITSMPQFAIVVGIVTGFFICYGTSHIRTSTVSWRFPFAFASFLAFTLASACYFVPPSPRWLMSRGETEHARAVMIHLGLDQVEQEELLSTASLDIEDTSDMTFVESVKHMFRSFVEALSSPFRGRTLFVCFIMAMQQFSGIDGVLYYAPTLFQQAGLSSEQSVFLASGVSALLILAATIPASLFADKWGRKTSALLGGKGMIVLMLIIGSLYAADEVHPHTGISRWVVIVSIYLFAITYSATWGVSFRTFVVESLPRKTRSSASSLAQSSNWAANYTVALITPIMISTTSFGAYFLFAGCTLLCTIVIFLFMFETRGHSLEHIEKRYAQRKAMVATGKWNVEGLKLKRTRHDV